MSGRSADGSGGVGDGTVVGYRADQPALFGYLRNHWEAGRDAIESTDRSYARTNQLLADGPDELDARTLGCVLTAFCDLGVLSIHSSGGGKNLYDLTSYDPERLAVVVAALQDG
jgi:hypothetical protein